MALTLICCRLEQCWIQEFDGYGSRKTWAAGCFRFILALSLLCKQCLTSKLISFAHKLKFVEMIVFFPSFIHIPEYWYYKVPSFVQWSILDALTCLLWQILVLEAFNFAITMCKSFSLPSAITQSWIEDMHVFLEHVCQKWSPQERKIETICCMLDLLVTCAYTFPEHQLLCMSTAQVAFTVQAGAQTKVASFKASLFGATKVIGMLLTALSTISSWLYFFMRQNKFPSGILSTICNQ